MTDLNQAAAMAELNNLDTLLADLDLDDATEASDDVVLEALDDLDLGGDEEVVEELVEVTDPSDMDEEELQELELAVERTEAYNAQESTPIASEEEQEAIKAKSAKKKRASSGTKSSTPRTPRELSAVPAEFFVLTGDDPAMDDATKEEHKVETMSLKPTQVKVAEKFENLFTSLSAGKAPSVYIMSAFKLLLEKGTMTSADLVGAYKLAGLGEGTARSQSGQIMNLFAAVKIADRTGQTLTLRADSNIAERLRTFV